MATLLIPITDLGQSPKAGVEVIAYLCDLNGEEIPGMTSEGILINPSKAVSDSSGVATMSLAPNSEVIQENTYYAIDVLGAPVSPPIIIQKGSGSETLVDTVVASPAALGSGARLGDLVDVTTAGVADNDALVYDLNTDSWVAGPVEAAPMTGSAILAALLPVDGPGSGLDADTLDGLSSAAFSTPASVTAAISAHTTAIDPHEDRDYTDAEIAGHLADADPHSDRAYTDTELTAHEGATDPHGDRSYTDAEISGHSADVDPHGDRAFTTSAISTHSGAADPHGDRAFTTAAISTHSGASDPHGDRANAATLYVPLTGGTITGNLVVQVSGGTKAIRQRTSAASSVDIEAAGADLWFSVWSGAGFTGTQRFLMKMSSTAQEVYLGGTINFSLNLTTPIMFINPTSGTAGLGSKNSLSNHRFSGRHTTTAGPPTSGAWVVGDTMQDVNGAFWMCTVAGSPGTWAGGSGVVPSTSTAGTTYTIASADIGTAKETSSASAVAVTVPTLPIGSVVEMCQYGAGQITFGPDSGITLRSASGLKTRAQYSSVSLRWRTATEVVLAGDLTT